MKSESKKRFLDLERALYGYTEFAALSKRKTTHVKLRSIHRLERLMDAHSNNIALDVTHDEHVACFVDGYYIEEKPIFQPEPLTWYMAILGGVTRTPTFIYIDASLDTFIINETTALASLIRMPRESTPITYYKIRDGLFPPIHHSLLHVRKS